MGGGDVMKGVPEDVRGRIEALQRSLIEASGNNLAGLILYGGLARGRFRLGRSDVNLVVLLRDTGEQSLATVAPALRKAWREIRVEPLILTPPEVPAAAEAFPLKFMDIQESHLVLVGEDPFIGFTLDPQRVRLRALQELRNLELRLRRRYLASFDAPEELTRHLARTSVPLAIPLRALLRIGGAEVGGDPAAVFAKASEVFGLDQEGLHQLVAVREGGVPENASRLYHVVLASIAKVLAASRG